METTELFSSKAAKYARYRWDYAPQAIQTIFEVTQLTHQSSIADIAAGTGILTKHFIGKVKQVFAVEPNPEMRQFAIQTLGASSSCQIMDGRAEATTLADHSVDAITVAQAIHWFKPERAKAEFLRILKPGGWLAIVRNEGMDKEIGEALGKIFPAETSTAALMIGNSVPISFYYGGNEYLKQTFEFTKQETWEQLMGGLASASYAPDEGSPLYASFERAAREVFERFSAGGFITSHPMTELCLGQMKELSTLQF